MTRRPRIADLTEFAAPQEPAVSPDGTQIAYVLRTADAGTDRDRTCLWRVGARDGTPEQLTHGPADTAPAWSPDGTRLAFLRRSGPDDPAQIWLLPATGGEPRRLTTLPQGAGAPVWSPDGDRIAYTAPVGEKREHAPIVTEQLGVPGRGEQLYVLDLTTGTHRQITDGEWPAHAPAWSPDGSRLAWIASTEDDADLHFREPVHVLDLTERGAAPRVVAFARGLATSVAWDGDHALVTAGREHGPGRHQHLLRVPLDGGAVTDLAVALDRNVTTDRPRVTADGTVLFTVNDRGDTPLYGAGPAGLRPVLAGGKVAGFAYAGSTIAAVLRTSASLGEVVTIDLTTGEQRVRTSHGHPEIEFFPRVPRDFTISDGTVVHGWLIRDEATAGPGPLLLDVHGGPHGSWGGAADSMCLYHQELAALGWTVLLLDPRGSDGYGEEFYHAVVGGWGTADANDLLEPIDQLVAEGVADPDRLALTGYSYGGYMACYLTSRDDRFSAAVAGGLISDLVSMAGTTDIAHFLGLHEMSALPWEDPARYTAMNPMTQVEKVATPTLILHGADDVRCPPGQAQQWHAALRQLGVPVQIVWYPGADHIFPFAGRPSHRMDYDRRTLSWVRQHTTGALPALDPGRWTERLATLADRHGVPGAALGILQLDGDRITAAHGVLNARTGVEVTADSLFQIGSISKIWTTTLIMQLVDDGRLELDAPVADVLPEVKLADADGLTVRHLLTHTSGLDGDLFTDTGRGDDCVERYAAALSGAVRTHPLGATWSYCNSGFVLAGRVVERLTGLTWDEAVRERIAKPLGLSGTGTLPEEALLHRAAVGHLPGDDGPRPTPVWMLPRAFGPAGLIHSTVDELLTFARLHLTGGTAPDGTRVLSEKSVAAMAEHQVTLPDPHTLGESWGLGWARTEWDGQLVLGHDGNTVGQSAYLRVIPSLGVAVALLTNGDNAVDLAEELLREVVAAAAGVTVPPRLGPPPTPVAADITPHVGRYRRTGAEIEVRADGPTLRMTVTGELAALIPDPVREYRLVPVADDLYLLRPHGSRVWSPVTFHALPTGEQFVHLAGRATPRVG